MNFKNLRDDVVGRVYFKKAIERLVAAILHNNKLWYK
jgi:hypothetical protein